MGKNQDRPKASQSLAVRPSKNSAGKRRRVDPDDIAESFSYTVGLTFIFLSGHVCAQGPDKLCALAMLHYSNRGIPYRSPEEEIWRGRCETERDRRQVEKAVESELEKLRQAGVSFALCWNVAGEDRVRFDYSDDYEEIPVKDFADFMFEEFRCDLY